MWFSVISIFPEYFKPIIELGITQKAFNQNNAEILVVNPRDFTTDNYQKVDDRPFGGGAGMVMMAEPLAKAIKHCKSEAEKNQLANVPVVYMSPQGQTLNDDMVNKSLEYDGMIIICGRYDGIDERIIQNYVDFECSIGDYVLSGGEIPAMALMDSIIRKIPNVLGHQDSITEDSFVNGLLDYPQYTKPTIFENSEVPEILKSGNHKRIKHWRFKQQYVKTRSLRPDLLENIHFTKEEQQLIQSLNVNKD